MATKEDTQHNVGKIIKEGERDAIHIAVMPVIAHAELSVGEDIGYSNGKTTSNNPIGIVDPFLKETVEEGEMFYMFLYPNSITSLKHLWTHPNVNDEIVETVAPTKKESEIWLRNFIDQGDCPGYDVLIAAVEGKDIHTVKGYEDVDWAGYSIDHEYFHFSGLDAHSEIPEEFWVHMENVTGKKIKYKPASFSCSC